MVSTKLSIAVSLATLSLVISDWALSLPRDPNFLCFRRSSNGTVENLEPMCPKPQKIEESRQTTSNGKPSNAPGRTQKKVEISDAVRKKLDFLNSNFDGTRLVITFKNRTRDTLSNPSISYTARKDRKTVDTGRIRGNRIEVEQDQEVGFKTVLDQEADVIEILAIE